MATQGIPVPLLESPAVPSAQDLQAEWQGLKDFMG